MKHFKTFLKGRQKTLEQYTLYEKDYYTSVEIEEIVNTTRRLACRFMDDPGRCQYTVHAALAYVGRILRELFTPDVPKEMLSLREASRLLGYTEKGLRKIVARKGIECFQSKPWAPIKFKREWIDNFVESHTKQRPVARPKSKPLSYADF